MTTATSIALIVIHPFGSYVRGTVITDASAIAAIRAGGRMGSVIQTVIPSGAQASKGGN